MLGRGVDQIMAHPSDPTLHETWVGDARRYVELAEARSGPIPRRVPPGYVWGDAAHTLRDADASIINLETAVCTASHPWPDKGIHYRMHPRHVNCMWEAGIDVCALSNNHVLDWCRQGLFETLDALSAAGVSTCGAGPSCDTARRPACVGVDDDSRVLVLGRGTNSSGIPDGWEAGPDRAGVALVDPDDPGAAREMTGWAETKRRGDILVASLHWGGNWGYRIPRSHRRFAHDLVDLGVDVVHGHSSHHPLGVEIQQERPIIYGCGDLITDYEGIGGYEEFRPDLALIYLITIDADSGKMQDMQIEPWRVHKFQLVSPTDEEVEWLTERMGRECRRLGTAVTRAGSQRLRVEW